MKKLFTLTYLLCAFQLVAQIPPGYYTPAAGLTGEPLRAALRNVIRPHTQLTYTPGLWNAYYTTDVKPSGKVWDMYSDVPGGTPAYEYTIGTDQCTSATPTAEGSCYNREHTWPQSKFSSDTPMQTDLFHVIPTDYIVNYTRGDLPYGMATSSITTTFTNGSKIGDNGYAGSPSGNCYEPLDSFKGDIARIYFYMTTCYRNDSAKFSSWEMAYNSRLKPWAIQMFLEWHRNDPVSKKEIDRNNKAYAIQRNRNPFVDHPEYAECIWGTGPCIVTSVDGVINEANTFNAWYNNNTHTININPEPTPNYNFLMVMDANGRKVFEQQTSLNSSIDASAFANGLYIVVATGSNGSRTQKLVIQ